jgi:hypothetical protein
VSATPGGAALARGYYLSSLRDIVLAPYARTVGERRASEAVKKLKIRKIGRRKYLILNMRIL